MHALARNLQVLWRLETLIAHMRLRVVARSLALYMVAGLIAVFGLAMLNVVGFLAAEPRWGAMGAAGAVAVADFAIAGVVALLAAFAKPGRELELAAELRQKTLEDIEGQDFQSLLASLFYGAAGSTVSGLMRDPLATAAPAVLIPLITAIIRALRKRKADVPG